VAILVNIDSEKRVRVNITARESQIERIDRLAQEAGMTRSAYFVQAALNEGEHRNEQPRRLPVSSARDLTKQRHKTERIGTLSGKQRAMAERRNTQQAGKQNR
jgi:hypothetical protein